MGPGTSGGGANSPIASARSTSSRKPAHAHTLRVLHPLRAVPRCGGLEQQRDQRVRLDPRDPARSQNAARSVGQECGSLDPQQRPRAARRHTEALLGVVVDAAEAEIMVQPMGDHEVAKQRRHARVLASLEPHPTAQPRNRGRKRRRWRDPARVRRPRHPGEAETPADAAGGRWLTAGVVDLGALRVALCHRLGVAGFVERHAGEHLRRERFGERALCRKHSVVLAAALAMVGFTSLA